MYVGNHNALGRIGLESGEHFHTGIYRDISAMMSLNHD